MDTQNFSLSSGQKIIKRYVDELPNTPGVYRMLDHQNNALYVGKAKNLKARVSNYVNALALNTRLQRMISQTVSMEITTTRSEAEALLLPAIMIFHASANIAGRKQKRENILARLYLPVRWMKPSRCSRRLFCSGRVQIISLRTAAVLVCSTRSSVAQHHV
jgi:hypothetical protein